MAVYMISFRLAQDSTYDKRWEALYAAAYSCARTRVWQETSSFILIDSDQAIDSVAKRLKQAVNPAKDIVLVKQDGVKAARVIGKVDDGALFDLMPYLLPY